MRVLKEVHIKANALFNGIMQSFQALRVLQILVPTGVKNDWGLSMRVEAIGYPNWLPPGLIAVSFSTPLAWWLIAGITFADSGIVGTWLPLP